jgi:hypothetical protein
MPAILRILAATLVAAALSGCRERSGATSSATTKPVFTKGVVGVWAVRTELTLSGVTAVPDEMHDRFADLAAYKAWLRPKVDGLQFEFYPEGKVFLRSPGGGRPAKFTWERREDGSYWLRDGGLFPLAASIGHRIDMTSDHSAVCRYQVAWNENSAARSPLALEKGWE